MTPIRPLVCALALAAVSACTAPGTERATARGAPQVTRLEQAGPPGAAPGTCWGKHVSPAVIETVTRHVIARPPEVRADGTVTRPAVYRTETRQEIVRERQETWFETPCDDLLTTEFVASLQRALAARGLFHGPVTGAMDSRTRAAVRRFQKPQGLDSGVLSLAAARKLGLVAVARPEDG